MVCRLEWDGVGWSGMEWEGEGMGKERERREVMEVYDGFSCAQWRICFFLWLGWNWATYLVSCILIAVFLLWKGMHRL